VVFRWRPKARRLDTRRGRFAPVYLRDELPERAAETANGAAFVPQRTGVCRGDAEIERAGPRAACLASGLRRRGQTGDIARLPQCCRRCLGESTVLRGRAGMDVRAALIERDAIAAESRQPRAEGATGPAPQRLGQCDAVHRAAAQAQRGDGVEAGCEDPAGAAEAGFAADCQGQNPAMVDEIDDDGDQDGEGVEGCGSAGPSPR